MKRLSILVVAFIVLILNGCVADGGVSPTTSKENKVDTTEATTATNTSTPTETTEVENIPLTDWDIVIRDGHPRFDDDEKLPGVVWNDVPKEKVLLADTNASYLDTNIITTHSFKGKLDSIEVYFSHFSPSISITVEEALPVIKTYLPTDRMTGLFEINKAFIATPKDSNDKDIHYFIEYTKTEEAKENNPDLFYNVVVEIVVNNGQVQMFRVFDDMPNWTRKLDFNGYAEEVWEYDFLAE